MSTSPYLARRSSPRSAPCQGSGGAAWLGLNANPVVHGRVDDAFLTDSLSGTYHGAFFTQDTMTVLHGRLPRLDATGEIALTPGVARLFGVGLGGRVTYQFLNGADQFPVSTGYSSYRVVGIVEIPPALVDQFDQTQGAVLPPAATVAAVARHRNAVEFSWVGMRLAKGSAGIPSLQSTLAGLAESWGARERPSTFVVSTPSISRSKMPSGPRRSPSACSEHSLRSPC